MTTPVGWVTLNSLDPPLSVTARLADERPNLDDGLGGWDVVERPRRSPLTSWKGSPAVQLTLPLLIDEWASGVSIEPELSDVVKMGRPTATDGEPPQITLETTGNAIPYSTLTYVVQSVAWGDALMNDAGNKCRQFFTLTLIEYVEDRYLKERSAANRRKKKLAPKKKGAAKKKIKAKKSARKVVKKKATVRRAGFGAVELSTPVADEDSEWGTGEDLVTIAARELGDADRWIEIAQLNGLRDPMAVMPGQELRLP